MILIVASRYTCTDLLQKKILPDQFYKIWNTYITYYAETGKTVRTL